MQECTNKKDNLSDISARLIIADISGAAVFQQRHGWV